MPVIVLPQFFLCGLLVPREQMAGWLQAISDVLPLSYAVEALQEVGRSAPGPASCGGTSASSPAPPCSPSRWRRRPCGGGPAERSATGSTVGTAPREPRHPGRRPDGCARKPSPSAASTAPPSAGSRRRPGSTRRWCTTTSATRTSCSSPPSTHRPTRRSCCRRSSPRRRTSSVPRSCAWCCTSGTGRCDPPVSRCCGRRSATSGRRSCCASSSCPGCCGRWSARSATTPTSVPPARSLVASQLIGLVMTRYVLRLEPLASASHDSIVAAIGPTVQRYLTGDVELPRSQPRHPPSPFWVLPHGRPRGRTHDDQGP